VLVALILGLASRSRHAAPKEKKDENPKKDSIWSLTGFTITALNPTLIAT
jgi:hypothetical protein